jgi:hypothetical protein
MRVALNEKDSVRISTLATLVVVAMRPNHRIPGAIEVLFIQSAMMCGGAAGALAIVAGHGTRSVVAALAATGVPAGGSSHPANTNAIATTAHHRKMSGHFVRRAESTRSCTIDRHRVRFTTGR